MLYRRLVRGLLVLAVLLALGGALAPPLASAVWPRYRVWTALPLTYAPAQSVPTDAETPLVARRPAGLDPWGRPWAEHASRLLDVRGRVARSVGPDGVDDGGAGDDAVLDHQDPTPMLIALVPSCGALLAFLVLWLVAVIQALAGGRGPSPWHDVLRAAVAASPGTAFVALIVAAVGVPRALRELPLVVPAELAVIGAVALVLTLAALGWRMRPGVRRRTRARLGPALIAGSVLFTACVASLRGLGLKVYALDQRQPLLWAQLGARPSVEQVLQGDEETLDAYLALEPDVEWQLLSSDALRRLVGRLGAHSSPYLARALRWQGHALELRTDVWASSLAQDVGLRALAAALADEPDRYTGLLLTRPTLAAALLGAERTLAALRPLERHVERREADCPPFEPAAVYPEHAVKIRRLAGDAVRLLSGGDDAWVVVRVRGLATSFGNLRCGATLEGRAQSDSLARDGEACAFDVLGPLDAAPAGLRLVVVDLNAPGRSSTLSLPALEANATLWVEVDLGAGQAGVRPLPRPASRAAR